MAGQTDSSADVSALMEALWGPRRGGPAGPVSGPSDSGTGEVQEARQDRDDGTADLRQTLDTLRAELAAVESRLDQRVAGLVAIHEEGLASVRAELAEIRATVDSAKDSPSVDEANISSEREHSQLRADLQAHMVEQLGLVMQEVMRQVDARATVIETELNSRFEASVTTESFVALRTELRGALTSNMASAQAALQQRADLLDAAVADLKAQAARRLDEMATLVATEAAAAGERSALAALRRRFPPS